MTETMHLISQATLKPVQRRSINNRNTLAGQCECFRCLSTFTTECVTDWADAGQTALCPVCGIDAVLSSVPASINSSMLQQMRHRWFETIQPLSVSDRDQAIATGRHPRAPG